MSVKKSLINESNYFNNWKDYLKENKMSRWGKPRKNTKRIDPRYFLNEKMERLDEGKGDYIMMVPSNYPQIVDEDDAIRNALDSVIHQWLYKNKRGIAKASGMVYGGQQGPLQYVFNDDGSDLAQQNWPSRAESNFKELVDVPLGKHLSDSGVLQTIMRSGQDRGRRAMMDAIRDGQETFGGNFYLSPQEDSTGMG
tara:strand:+ start:51 stop:638 length:588 start_codon:yes stop_codon:yes gene_type:complete